MPTDMYSTEPDWFTRALAKSRRTRIGAILRCAAGLKTTAGPYFSGKATITSDGFVMCNFTAEDGTRHLGAFVGSLDDICANIITLQAACAMSDPERREIEAVIQDWIGTDYRPTRKLFPTVVSPAVLRRVRDKIMRDELRAAGLNVSDDDI